MLYCLKQNPRRSLDNMIQFQLYIETNAPMVSSLEIVVKHLEEGYVGMMLTRGFTIPGHVEQTLPIGALQIDTLSKPFERNGVIVLPTWFPGIDGQVETIVSPENIIFVAIGKPHSDDREI